MADSNFWAKVSSGQKTLDAKRSQIQATDKVAADKKAAIDAAAKAKSERAAKFKAAQRAAMRANNGLTASEKLRKDRSARDMDASAAVALAKNPGGLGTGNYWKDYNSDLKNRIKPKTSDKKDDAKKAAERRATPEAASRREAARAKRIKAGDFKGKYYGPDEFKGNTKLIDEWKKAGKPNRQSFAYSRGLSGTKD